MKTLIQKTSLILFASVLVLFFQNCGNSLNVAEENLIIQASEESAVYASVILQGRLDTSSIITAKMSSEEEIENVNWRIDCDLGFASVSLKNEFYFHCKNPGKVKLSAEVEFASGKVHQVLESYSMVGSPNVQTNDLVGILLPQDRIVSGDYIEAKAEFYSEVNAKVSWRYICYAGAESIHLSDVDPRYSSLLSVCEIPEDFPNDSSLGSVAIQIGQDVILEKSFEISRN
ncbi:MAG: hypothetical protein VX642_01935 [Bdellovibrionota bacterium]|nr:hypothetical protein [Bdellovibrionota bacterium]